MVQAKSLVTSEREVRRPWSMNGLGSLQSGAAKLAAGDLNTVWARADLCQAVNRLRGHEPRTAVPASESGSQPALSSSKGSPVSDTVQFVLHGDRVRTEHLSVARVSTALRTVAFHSKSGSIR